MAAHQHARRVGIRRAHLGDEGRDGLSIHGLGLPSIHGLPAKNRLLANAIRGIYELFL